MLDKLVSLSIDPGDTALPAKGVEVELCTTAPHAQARLRLWNPDGRDPREPPRVADSPNRWRLGTVRELVGWTLTWSVRMAAFGPGAGSYYELRLQVFQDQTLLPDGDFYYAGPLDGLEERSGGFHFRKA